MDLILESLIDFFKEIIPTLWKVEVLMWSFSPFFCVIMNLAVLFGILAIYSMKYLETTSYPNWNL